MFPCQLQRFQEHEASVEEKQGKTLCNMALARMHNDIGNRNAAFAVWEIGLPRDLYSRFNFNREVTSPADSKGVIPKALLQSMLSEEGQLLLKEHIKHVTSWLRKVANAIQSRKQTNAYKDVQAHAGKKNVRSLEPEEQKQRRCERKLHADLAWAKQLYDKWDPSLLWKGYNKKESDVLWRYCQGRLQQEIENLKAQPRGHRTKRLEPFRASE
jgi:uncharacterized membrane-anchored protein YhcB (DUF1043 family)